MRVQTPPIIAHMGTTVALQKVGEGRRAAQAIGPQLRRRGGAQPVDSAQLTDSRRSKITRLDFLAGRSR